MSLTLCVSLLLLFVASRSDVVLGCSDNCTVTERVVPAPPITEEKIAVLHGKCYSLCMNKLMLAHGEKQHIDCDTIQSIESCQDGCLLHGLYPKKMKGVHCSNHCTTRCGEMDGTKIWKKPYRAGACPRHCKKDSCEIGCAVMKQQPSNKHKSFHLTIPSPEIRRSGRGNHFTVKETKLVKHNDRYLRVAMVIKIQDNTTNTTYYDWQPGLRGMLNLQYFACKNVLLSVKLLFGYATTEYSIPSPTCVDGNNSINKKKENRQLGEESCDSFKAEVVSKVSTMTNQIDMILQYIKRNVEETSTSEDLKNMLNELKKQLT